MLSHPDGFISCRACFNTDLQRGATLCLFLLPFLRVLRVFSKPASERLPPFPASDWYTLHSCTCTKFFPSALLWLCSSQNSNVKFVSPKLCDALLGGCNRETPG